MDTRATKAAAAEEEPRIVTTTMEAATISTSSSFSSSSKSNLRKLRAQLSEFAEELDRTAVLATSSSSLDAEAERDDAAVGWRRSFCFLRNQRDRADDVERALDDAEEELLAVDPTPPDTTEESTSKKTVTATELARLLQSLQDVQARQMDRLERQIRELQLVRLSDDNAAIDEPDGRPSPANEIESPSGCEDEGEEERNAVLAEDQQQLQQKLDRHLSAKMLLERELDRSDEYQDESLIIGGATVVAVASAPASDETYAEEAYVDDDAGHECDEEEDIASGDKSALPEPTSPKTLLAVAANMTRQQCEVQLELEQDLVAAAMTVDDDSTDEEEADNQKQIRENERTVQSKGDEENDQQQQQQVDDDESSSEDEEDEDEDDDEVNTTYDDSALYCATVVANRRGRQLTVDASQDAVRNLPFSPSQFPHRFIGHIEVDHDAASPAPTNLTMDSSMMTPSFRNDADEPSPQHQHGQRNQNLDTVFECEETELMRSAADDVRRSTQSAAMDSPEAVRGTTLEAVEETPVLDRYRIDVDDESPHGFRVVPNTRRKKKKTGCSKALSLYPTPSSADATASTSTSTAAATTPATKESATMEASHSPSAIATAKGTSALATRTGMVGTSTYGRYALKRFFRKTPRGKTSPSQRKVVITRPIDENAPLSNSRADDSEQTSPTLPPQNGERRSVEHAASSTGADQVFGTGTAVTPQTRKAAVVSGEDGDGYSMPPSLLYTKAEFAMRGDCDLVSPLTTRTAATVTKKSPAEMKFAASGEIRHVTASEYDDAPRVVRMQVSLDEVQRATEALNLSLREKKQRCGISGGAAATSTGESCDRDFGGDRAVLLGEQDVKRILKVHGFDERKSKTVLMSLCHWRRLIMRRSPLSSSDMASPASSSLLLSPSTASAGGSSGDEKPCLSFQVR